MRHKSRWQRRSILMACRVVGVLLLLFAEPRSGTAATARPNVVILVADDLGFSDLGCFGSEIATPALDELADTGVVFTNFHTAATCSPTRAMLLTGVDHHLAGMGTMYEFLDSAPEQRGQPGYEGHLNDSVVTLAELLKSAGYHTAISGKWHLGGQLVLEQTPLARGFDRSWVLWTGWSEHFTPAVGRPFIEGNRRVPYPQGKYSTEWYTDKAIEYADEAIDQRKPFFLTVAYTAPHWPLEAPDKLLARQMGKYDDGFDELRHRRIRELADRGIIAPGIPLAAIPAKSPVLQHEIPNEATKRWNELSAAERAYSARLMEVHAAMIEALDQQISRLLTHLKNRDQLDNTLVLFLSDNGASSMSTTAAAAENRLENVGRSGSFVAIGPEWARASSGPLRLMKGYPTEGGTRVPAIIKLPNSRKHQWTAEFASVLDIAPTIYELLGIAYPQDFDGHALHPLNGTSLLPYLRGQRDSIHTADDAMGWELFGRAAFRRGRWKITWVEQPFGGSEFELFDVAADPGEARDLRNSQPEVYRQLLAGFDEYARRHGVITLRPAHWRR